MPNGMLLLAVSIDILCVQKVNGTSFPFLGYLFIECISVAHASLRFWFSRLHQQQILLSHRRKVSSQPGMVVAKASLPLQSQEIRANTLLTALIHHAKFIPQLLFTWVLRYACRKDALISAQPSEGYGSMCRSYQRPASLCRVTGKTLIIISTDDALFARQTCLNESLSIAWDCHETLKYEVAELESEFKEGYSYWRW
ncbi:hypothetical protein PVK06_010836 [Gossypium arboreum]|uniref:Uncharacterized protein n=1 Tax=Gossypium arboreum TaxID=29729 RepID=A0ABR0Q739_GOSAR|nr:hypothetical protein PVK06_010836 [Gossypium arboreum]